jgi:hypothetical protein
MAAPYLARITGVWPVSSKVDDLPSCEFAVQARAALE